MKEVTTRVEFFRQLKKNLRFKYGSSDMQSIVSDYEEIFDIELARGLSEQDICRTLGNPAVIVRNLDQEMHTEKRKVKPGLFQIIAQNIYYICACMAAGIIIYTMCNSYRFSNYFPILIIEMLILFPAMTALIWLGIKKNIPAPANDKRNQKILAVLHLLCIASVLLVIVIAKYVPIMYTQQRRFLGLEPWQIGPLIAKICTACIVVLCTMILYGIYQMKKKSACHFTLIAHALGAIWVNVYYLNLLSGLDTLKGYNLNLWAMGILYIETVAVTALAGFCIKKKELR